MLRGPAFGSVRSRLALMLTALQVILLGAFTVIVYNRVESWTVDELDRTLERDLLRVAEAAARGVPPEQMLEQPRAPSHAAVARAGRLVATTPEWHASGLDRSVRSLTRGKVWWTSPEGPAWRMRRASVTTGLQVVVARDGTAQLLMLERLYLVLGFGLCVMIVAGAAAAWVFAADATRPLRSLAAQASAIDADRLSSNRLRTENPHDEFGVLAATFNRTLDRLDGSFRQLHRFTSDASHQLRTPLAAVRATGEAGLTGPSSEARLRATVETMLEQSGRLRRLVDELLVLARADSGQTRARPGPMDIASLVRETVESLQILAEEKAQRIELHVEGAPPARADPDLLRHALLNIMDNAIRYAPEGGTIRVTARAEPGGSVSVAVDDTGQGIPEAERERVFERFYRSQESVRSSPDGTGLGLPIARWCVESCGGTINAESAPTGGARLRIVLPGA